MNERSSSCHATRTQSAWQRARDASTVRAALTSAAVAGTLLNLVNQGKALASGDGVDWWRIALTYCVPYVVATFGAVRGSARPPGAGPTPR